MAKTKKVVEPESKILRIELPTVPNFPYQTRDVTPPKGVVLILATECGYVLGDWDGYHFFDPEYRKIEPVYGKVLHWCILFAEDGAVVMVEEDDD